MSRVSIMKDERFFKLIMAALLSAASTTWVAGAQSGATAFFFHVSLQLLKGLEQIDGNGK